MVTGNASENGETTMGKMYGMLRAMDTFTATNGQEHEQCVRCGNTLGGFERMGSSGVCNECLDKDVREQPGACDKCERARKRLVNTGTADFPYWQSGTCLHREARRVNTKEMHGRGRRGY
jgi:hypothetical protein